MGQYGSLIFMAVLIAAMYFLMIRPQKKQEKELQKLRDNLKVGDEITTIGGFIGVVVKVKQDTVVIQMGADKTRAEITKWAVNTVNNKSKSSDSSKKEDGKPDTKKIKRLDEKETSSASETTEQDSQPQENTAE